MRRAAVVAVTVLLAGLVTVVPAAAAPAPTAATDRLGVLALMKTGGPAAQRAAEAALCGTDAQFQEFLTTGQHTAREHDDRTAAAALMASAGPATKTAGTQALAGNIAQVREFLATGWKVPIEQDFQSHRADLHRGRPCCQGRCPYRAPATTTTWMVSWSRLSTRRASRTTGSGWSRSSPAAAPPPKRRPGSHSKAATWTFVSSWWSVSTSPARGTRKFWT